MENYEPGSCLDIRIKTPQQFDTKIYKFDGALFDAENWFSKPLTQSQQEQGEKMVHQWNLHSHRGQYRMAVKKLEGLKKYPFNHWKQSCASQYLKKTIGKAEINRGDYYYFYPKKDTNNIAFIINPNLSKTQNAMKVLQNLPKKIRIEKFSNGDTLFDAEQSHLIAKSLANWQLPKQKPQRGPLSSCMSYAILKKQLQTCAWCNNMLWKGKGYFDRCNKCRGLPTESFKEALKPRLSYR
jgi:hypothetical protein